RKHPPVRASHSSNSMVVMFGPIQRLTRSSSVIARKTFSGGASKSRVIVIVGRLGSASIRASRNALIVITRLLPLLLQQRPRPWLPALHPSAGTVLLPV